MPSLTEAIDQLIHDDDIARLPAWNGAPLRFHQEYWPAKALDAAFDRYILIHGDLDCIAQSHMWHRALCTPPLTIGIHTLDMFNAELRSISGLSGTEYSNTHGQDAWPVRIHCDPCHWYTITDGDNAAIEAWHDHALPGWRSLPTLPDTLRGKMGGTKMTREVSIWLKTNYPQNLQIPGAPIITRRGNFGTRHVPSYSPYGGYDLAGTDH